MAYEKRLIDANALKIPHYITEEKDLFIQGYQNGKVDAITEIVALAPTVDVVEVKHGRWQPHYEIFDADPAVGILGGNYQTGWQCSVCGRYESIQEPYCNCGAKMDGDGNGKAD